MSMKLLLLFLFFLLGCSWADFVLKVHWTHENGTQLELAPEKFAQMADEERNGGGVTKRNAVKDWKYLWNMGTIYYDIDARTIDFRLLQILSPAFEFFHKYTCIRWKRRVPGDFVKDYVVFTMPYGGVRLCNSAVGRQTGRQYINLDSECTRSLAKVLHQMTHALGFYHMHTRLDRDKYVSVYPDRAEPFNRKFFDIVSTGDSMGFPYEHKSLMHFDGLKYARGSNPTIVSKIPGLLLGNNRALTVQDVTMINTLYSQCQVSCRFSNGQCEQTCDDQEPGKVICSCIQGYRINPDKKTCYDTDECSIHNGGCEHLCETHGAWYRCECRKGFGLDKNGYSCRASNLCEDGSLRCEQECYFNKCVCKNGYTLNKDGLSCDDVNECLLNNGDCENGCENTLGSRLCNCKSGQFLSNDGMSCTDITCPMPSVITGGVVNCTNKDMVEGTVCTYSCQRGHKISRPTRMKCLQRAWSSASPVCEVVDRCQFDNGRCEQRCWARTWDDVSCSCKSGFVLHKNGKNCTDIEPPTVVTCPSDIYTNTVPNKNFASVTWDLPIFYDNVKAKIVSGPVMQDKIGGVYDIGAHAVEYLIQDAAGLKSYCSFKIKVNDKEAPDMFNCPPTQTYELSSTQTYVSFAENLTPHFWDNSENVTVVTDFPKNRQLQPRSQEIHYIATDPSGNSAICTVKINVLIRKADCNEFPYEIKGGRMQCDAFTFGTQCAPVCDSGYDITREGIAAAYICRDSKWQPEPQKIICRDETSPVRPAILTYKLTYRAKCTNRSYDFQKEDAAATAKRYLKTLCPTAGNKCALSFTVTCDLNSLTVLLIHTSEPVKIPVTNRYINSLKDNIRKNQSGTFFYMPITMTITAPEKNSEGLKAVPLIVFECKKGDIEDRVRLKCYSGDAK